MQNGSGTYDPYILLNIFKNIDKIKYGAQFSFKFRPGDSNKYGYKYGNFFDSNIWTSYNFVHFISSSLKIIVPVGLFGLAIKIILVSLVIHLSILSQDTLKSSDFAVTTLHPAALAIIG